MSITVSHIRCERGGKPVLDDVSLALTPGRVLALVGPNGAGKSTLLGVITGDVPVTSGDVTLDGQTLTTWTPREMAQRRSVLLQHNDVAFAFTAREIVAMGRAPWPPSSDDERHIDEALALCDVEHLAERPYRALSGGERARVSLARVLAQDAPTVLLDEPTAALDLGHQEEVMRIARRLSEDDRAVAVVLHDLSLASAYADDVAVLSRGTLRAFGPPQQVLTPEVISEVYGVEVHQLATPDGHHIIVPRREAHTTRSTS